MLAQPIDRSEKLAAKPVWPAMNHHPPRRLPPNGLPRLHGGDLLVVKRRPLPALCLGGNASGTHPQTNASRT